MGRGVRVDGEMEVVASELRGCDGLVAGTGRRTLSGGEQGGGRVYEADDGTKTVGVLMGEEVRQTSVQLPEAEGKEKVLFV